MPANASEESGLEELLRLSREIGEMEKALVHDLAQAGEKIHRSEKKLALWELVKDIKESLILEKLRKVASEEIYREFDSLKKSRNTRGLRDLVFRVAMELEENISTTDDYKTTTEKLSKTLSVLLEYLFYID